MDGAALAALQRRPHQGAGGGHVRGRLGFVVGIVVIAVPFVASAGSQPTDLSVRSEPGTFWSQCGYSHRLPDDPIVAPGRPGLSHSHDFLGNRSTNAYSTYASLRNAGTSCHRPADAAGYWVPTLSQAGTVLTPMKAQAYYLQGRKSSTLRAFPAGLRMIAGNGRATRSQPMSIAAWSCTGSTSRSSEPPVCGSEQWLRMHIHFPDCWNGRDLDSADHRNHMAYANGRCPSSHPVAVPQLTLAVTYPTHGGSGIALASGSRYTGHGDFFNAWDQQELSRLVDYCLNGHRRCGPNGYPPFGL